jgi:hypothetical protein
MITIENLCKVSIKTIPRSSKTVNRKVTHLKTSMPGGTWLILMLAKINKY